MDGWMAHVGKASSRSSPWCNRRRFYAYIHRSWAVFIHSVYISYRSVNTRSYQLDCAVPFPAAAAAAGRNLCIYWRAVYLSIYRTGEWAVSQQALPLWYLIPRALFVGCFLVDGWVEVILLHVWAVVERVSSLAVARQHHILYCTATNGLLTWLSDWEELHLVFYKRDVYVDGQQFVVSFKEWLVKVVRSKI